MPQLPRRAYLAIKKKKKKKEELHVEIVSVRRAANALKQWQPANGATE